MNSQRLDSLQPGSDSEFTKHDEMIAVEGLEDLFKWASEVVSDGEDNRLKKAREHRIRRQVLEFVQNRREEEAVKKANVEIAYLQRRVIALLQQLQESTAENSALKQVLVSQHHALAQIPRLEVEIARLKYLEHQRHEMQEENKQLLTALSRLKQDRDFLDDLLTANEEENKRVAALLSQVKAELERLKSRKWWHWFLGIA